MAAFAPVRNDDQANPKQSVVISWPTMQVADTGNAAFIGDLVNPSIQVVSGGAGTAQIRVSNDGVTFVALTAALVPGAAGALPATGGPTNLGVNARFVDVNPVAGAASTVFLVGRRHGS